MNLTPYDTGEMLEPKLYVTSTAGVTASNRGDFGKVDFENDESATVLTMSAFPSTIHDETIVVQIDTDGLVGRKLMVVVNDGPALCHFDPETEEPPMIAAQNFVRKEITAAATMGGDAWKALARIAEHVGIDVRYAADGTPYLTETIR